MTKIYITRKIPDIAAAMLRDKGFEVDEYNDAAPPSRRAFLKALRAKPYDGVLSLLNDDINTEVFDTIPSAKIFANYAIGYNNIDIAEAKKRGITITNTAGDYNDSIAEHVMGMILALSIGLVAADKYVHQGKYKGWQPNHFLRNDIKGKTLGILGAGKIGQRVAHHGSRGFDMNVVYFDVVRNENIEKEYGALFRATPEEVLKEADFVSLHVPLLPTTRHLIDEKRLAMMKPGAFLINTSRGPVVDEVALVKALKQKKIAGAGLDVYEFEPKLAKGLTKLTNVVLTPHIASATITARNEMAVLAAQNLIDFFEGKTPRNVVGNK